MRCARRGTPRWPSMTLSLTTFSALWGGCRAGSPPTAAEPSVSVVEFPAAWVAYTRYQCYWKASRLFISRRAELLKLMDQAGLEPVDVNMAIFHSDYKKQFSEDPSDDEGDLEVCYRIKNPNPQLPNCHMPPAAFRLISLSSI